LIWLDPTALKGNIPYYSTAQLLRLASDHLYTTLWTQWYKSGFPVFCLQKIPVLFQDFPGQPKRFARILLWPSNVKLQTNSSYLLCTYTV